MLSRIYKKFEYTNYWLNYELQQNKKYPHISAEELYQKLKGKNKDFDENNLKVKIRNISEVDLNNMKILEKLYLNYYEFYKTISVYVTGNNTS